MLKIQPTQKQIKKYYATQNSEIKIPEKWADFAKMIKIRSGGEVIKFTPYDYQEKLAELMLERSVCVVKSRQLGISETIISFMLWRACLNPGYLGLVFSKTQADSSLLARRMKRMIASIDLKTVTENLSDIEILGRGRVLFRNSKPESARGIESVVDVFLDELAFLETGKEVYDSLAPAMQMVGDKARVFAVSTPNGKAGFYWDLLTSNNDDKDVELICQKASKGDDEPFQYWIDENGWAKILIHWKTHPIYGIQEDFLDTVHVKQKLSWETIEQEYNLSFQDLEVAVFNYETVRNGIDETLPSSIAKEKGERALYYLGIDSSTSGSDYTAALLLKEEEGKYLVAGCYKKRNQTSEYHLFNIGKIIEAYNPFTIAIEVTGGVGQVWFEQLKKQFPYADLQVIRTTGDSKPAMISNITLALEKGILKYPPKSPLIDELLSFRRNGKKLEAASGKHDDCVMALSFALAHTPFALPKPAVDGSRIGVYTEEDERKWFEEWLKS